LPIDYRYHIGSFVAIFLALLLGILVGIGLAPNPDELDRAVADLKAEFREAREAREEEVKDLQEANRAYETLAKEAVSGLIADRLSGLRVAIILDHEFGRDPLPDTLRALMKQAGAVLTSTTTITREFVTLPVPVRQKVAQRLTLYPPPGVHFRTLIARALAEDLSRARPDLIHDLQATGLLRSSADSDYRVPADAVLLVGGPGSSLEASPERIDLPMIEEFGRLGVRVVGCEPSNASVSCIPLYRAKGIPTVDNADTLPGQLAIVLALAGADGHFGVSSTADRLIPDIPPCIAR
jgi:hypothetical protein